MCVLPLFDKGCAVVLVEPIDETPAEQLCKYYAERSRKLVAWIRFGVTEPFPERTMRDLLDEYYGERRSQLIVRPDASFFIVPHSGVVPCTPLALRQMLSERLNLHPCIIQQMAWKQTERLLDGRA